MQDDTDGNGIAKRTETETGTGTGTGPDEAPVLPPDEVRAVLEALFFASPQPLTPRDIGKVLGGVPKEAWQAALAEIPAAYGRAGARRQLVGDAGRHQVTTRPEYTH